MSPPRPGQQSLPLLGSPQDVIASPSPPAIDDLAEMRRLYPFGFGAQFNEQGTHRWVLWRAWAEGRHALLCGLNPSKAGKTTDDPTIRKEVEFSKRWGLAGLRKVNAFSLVSTDPKALLTHPDAVGESTDAQIATELARPNLAMVVFAWGAFPEVRERAKRIDELVRRAGFTPQCLGTTKDGHPAHTCRLAYATVLEAFEGLP